MAGDLPPQYRLPLLVLGVFGLVGGVLAGLARLAWGVPPLAAAAAGGHGALMVSAFFGSVIGLERAVALKRPWAYLAPLLAGLSGAALLGGEAAAPLFALAASGVFVAASAAVLARQVASFTLTLAAGALSWLAGNLLWALGGPLALAVPWWLAFLVLTIAGERLELTRLLPTPPAARRVFAALAALLVAAAGLASIDEAAGSRVFGLALLGFALWLVRYDIARPNARQRGLTRFIALCLLGGYAWLAVAGALGVTGAFAAGHPWRDAALHALGLGFVFAMVFGHAAIVFPALLGVRIPYHPVFYLPLVALHATLLARVAAGVGGNFAAQGDAGLANALALALFFVVVLGRALVGLAGVATPKARR